MGNPQWWNQSSNRPGAYQRIRVFDVTDFTGGLNLVDDSFKLADNESPDMVNIDVDRRGGFQVRRGIQPFSTTALAADPRSLWPFTTSGTKYILAAVGGDVRYSTGGSWTTVLNGSSLAIGSTTEIPRAATFRDPQASAQTSANYIVRGNANVHKFTGAATATSMGTTFNDDHEAPSYGDVPRAKMITSHNGYMWVANTFESGTQYKSRLRFSHYLQAEDWASQDYIEIDSGKDSDEITAIMPIGDHLLVCKRDSTYAVFGDNIDNFTVVCISQTIGCVSQEACVSTQFGVAIFDHNLGLHVYSGKGTPVWEFGQLWPALRDNRIPQEKVDLVQMGWVSGRLWIGVPWEDNPTYDRGTTFVWNPALKPGGAYTRYDLAAGPFLSGHLFNQWCCSIAGTNRVMALEQDEYGDDFTGSGTLSVTDARYTTRWFDAGQASMKKRWRRMEAVMQTDQPYELPVVVHFDFDNGYNPSKPPREFKLTSSVYNDASATSAYWGDGTTRTTDTLWGSDSDTLGVGEGTWAGDDEQRNSVDRGAGLGLARSVSLTFGGPVTQAGTDTVPVFWGVDGLVFKFVPRRIR
jgi:hypothetical protein